MKVTTNLKKSYQIDEVQWLESTIEIQLPKIYQAALRYVRQKTGFVVDFPNECPYKLEELLDERVKWDALFVHGLK